VASRGEESNKNALNLGERRLRLTIEGMPALSKVSVESVQDGKGKKEEEQKNKPGVSTHNEQIKPAKKKKKLRDHRPGTSNTAALCRKSGGL